MFINLYYEIMNDETQQPSIRKIMSHSAFRSRQPNVYALHGMVATSQPLAAQARWHRG
jgi:hypothetical protein